MQIEFSFSLVVLASTTQMLAI